MSSIDERTVKMTFDNASFKKGAAETKTSLDNVNAAVDKSGTGKGLLSLSGHMETVRVKASAMQVAAVTAMANIANRAVNMGINVAKSLTLDPIKAGFDEYELKMKSIQTILANTKGENLQSVTAALDELNTYADKTIYNFGNMTDAIGKLTTAGIDLKTATSTVKGFSNMVALAGGDAQAASGAMEQFNQGLQAGVIRAMDWQSISTRGLGSQALQRSFYESAKAAGTLTDAPVGETFEQWGKRVGGFKNSLEAGWLTADVATDALAVMSGEVKTVAGLMKQGYSRKAAEDLLKIAADAEDSATKVRTFTGFMSTLREQIGSGWSGVMEKLIGNFNQSTKLFTGLSNATGSVIGGFFTYVEALLTNFRKLGGTAAILGTIQNLLAPIGAILGVITKAWTTAFPSGKAGSGLASAAKGLEKITYPLQILADLIRGAIGPITAFFQLLSIGKQIIVQLANKAGSFVSKLLGMVNLEAPKTGGLLDWIKNLGSEIEDRIDQIDDLLKKGASIKDAFNPKSLIPDVGSVLPKDMMAKQLGFGSQDKLSALGDKLKGGSATGFSFNPDAKLDGSRVSDASDTVSSGLDTAKTEISSSGNGLLGVLADLGKKFADFIQNFSMEDLMASFNLAVLSTFMLSLSRMFQTFSKTVEGMQGIGAFLPDLLDHVGTGMKSLQTQARAKLILNIAIAIGILALSLWVLSKIPADKLAQALAALATIGVVLNYAMKGFSDTIGKMDKEGTNLKMLTLGVSMVLFSVAVLILAAAFKKMNDVEWGSVIKGTVAMYAMTKAMQSLADIPKEDLVKAAFAMILVSTALIIFAIAVGKFAKLNFKEFAEGMAYATAALLALKFTLDGFTTSLGGAAALVVAVAALWLFADVIAKFAELGWKEFAKGLLLAGVALGVLVIAMAGFTSSLAGAAALVVAVGALYMLVGVIALFAKLDWGAFAKGMGMIAIAFLVMGSLMALMGVFSPLILLGAAALLIFGGAMFLLGAGILFLAKGMGALILIAGGIVGAITAMAVGLAVGFAVFLQTLALQAPIMKNSFLQILQSLIDTLVAAVPMVIDGIQRLWEAIKAEFTSSDKNTLMADSGQGWMEKIRDGIVNAIPKLVKLATDIAIRFLKALQKQSNRIASAAVDWILSMLDGISRQRQKLINGAIDLVIQFGEGIRKGASKLTNAAIDLIAGMLHDLASSIRSGASAIGGGITDVVDAFRDVGVQMIRGMIDGIASIDIRGAIENIANSLPGWARKILQIHSPSRVFHAIGKFIAQGMTQGIQDYAGAAIKATASMVGGQIAVATEYIRKFIQDLDQKAIAARGKAEGLALAASKAEKRANKTKTKTDDKAAKKISKRADAAAKEADRAEAKSEKAKEAEQRANEFTSASLLGKAKMKSEDAQDQLDAAKSYEASAAKHLTAANELEKQSRTKGLSPKERKKLRKDADKERAAAEADAKAANVQIGKARTSASEALDFQNKAGAEASAAFAKSFKDEADAAAKEAAFEKLSATEKAAYRREQAAEAQAKADADLKSAQELAYKDIEGANALAAIANQEAADARRYLDEANGFAANTANSSGNLGTVVNLDPTDAAAIAMSKYEGAYSQATASQVGGTHTEFNQYNTSPEALNPTEVYRKTNNLFAFAVDKLDTDAA